MALFGAGIIGEYWRAPTPDLAFVRRPLWISSWMYNRTASTVVNQGPACFQGTTAQTGIHQVAGDAGRTSYMNDINDAGTGSAVSIGPSFYNQWVSIIGVFVSSSLRYAYQNGVLAFTDTTTVTGTQTFTSFVVGQLPGAGLASANAVAEVAFGTGMLSDAQIKALAGGANPLRVAPSQLLAYYPLRGSLEDLGPAHVGLQGRSLSTPTAQFGEHPPVALPPRRRIVPHQAATVPPAVRPRISMVA